MRITLSLLFGIFIVANASSQELRLVDATTSQPIAFAHISFPNQKVLLTTGMNGEFKISDLFNPSDKIKITYVGYESLEMTLAELNEKMIPPNLVALQPAFKQLDEVTVASDDGAIEIIKEAYARRKENNPKFWDGYYYESYNKLYFTFVTEDDLIFNRERFAPSSHEKEKTDRPEPDSSMLAYVNERHIFLNESVSKKYFKRLNKEKEIVEASRSSGLQESSLAALATSFQPFSFYDNTIELLDKQFLNPISKGSERYYRFKIENAELSGQDTVFSIRFYPIPSKVFDGMRGVLHIHSSNYAISEVIAEPAMAEEKILYRIQQNYQQIEDGKWFPQHLRVMIGSSPGTSGAMQLYGQGDFQIYNASTDPALWNSVRYFDQSMQVEALNRQSAETMLATRRLDTLSSKELSTYERMDSLGNSPGMGRMIKVIQSLSSGRVGLGKWIDLDLSALVRFNAFENIRPGLGLKTSRNFSRVIQLSGYTGYGFGDRAWKFAGSAKYTFYPDANGYLSLNYLNDLQEPGATPFLGDANMLKSDAFRKFFVGRFDGIQAVSASLHMNSGANLGHEVYAGQEQLRPLYDYNFEDNIQLFDYQRLSYTFRYVRGERFINVAGQRILQQQGNQYLVFKAEKIFPEWDAISSDFWRLSAKMGGNIRLGRLGTSSINFYGGYTDADIPYPFLFNARGAGSGNFFFTESFFQAMGLFEFTANIFASAFLTHNLGYIGFERSYSRPEAHIIHGTGFGWLKEQQQDGGINIQDYREGYHESGLLIKNLLRADYLGTAYYNINIGAVRRWGAYTRENTIDNYQLLVSLEIGL
ncbi:MAG: DUF5686 and carboxypeptidase regulatory-like domain-containing protein [Cyclobacteriaceae bacterium]|nr:carboxypeptidase-like regulatory domain-containing protein [Cyclobacteriaceae bacterium]MCH8516568.1 DUF5686 and carboxypeptidase regulatory-like domain-containing protein [Cyclobacteriaceae bacterium]